MARSRHKSVFATKESRRSIAISKKPTFESHGKHNSLGYRRNVGEGTWVARCTKDSVKREHRIGIADDIEAANGLDILSYEQALDKALKFDPFKEEEEAAAALKRQKHQLDLDQALVRYEAELKTRGQDAGNVSRVRGHLSEELLKTPVKLLSVDDLKGWRNELVELVAEEELERSTVNRLMTPVRAALNLAYEEDQGKTITNSAAWDIGLKALEGASKSRNVILRDPIVDKIVKASYRESPEFGELVEVAATSGARCSQMSRLVVSDLMQGSEPTLNMPPSRKGKKGQKWSVPIRVVIPQGLANRLAKSSKGRAQNANLLLKPSGMAWGPSVHYKPFARAVKAAKLTAEEIHPYTVDQITIYALRHSSICRALLRNVPIKIVAANHDTSVKMIEDNYSRYISNFADAILREALTEFTPPPDPETESSLEAVPVAQLGGCRHGHSYAEFPPYTNSNGANVCSECARQRTRRNKAKKRAAKSQAEAAQSINANW